MQAQKIGFSVSLLLHLLLLGVAVNLGSNGLMTATAPLSLDFQLIADGSEGEVQMTAPQQCKAAVSKKVAKQQPPKPELVQETVPVPVEEKIETAAVAPAEEPVVQQEKIEEAEETPEGEEAQAAATLTASAALQADQIQAGQHDPDLARQQYVQLHYQYIQCGIQKQITYPFIARKRGWEGKVVVGFVICEDGRVENMRIIQSSGFKALDRNAVETIKRAAPFPNPPARAELTVPVIYRLREA